MVFDFSLKSDATKAKAKNAGYYEEFKDIVDAFQHSDSTMVFGPRLNGTVAQLDLPTVVAYSLTHAESDAYADRIGEWSVKLDERIKSNASWREADRS